MLIMTRIPNTNQQWADYSLVGVMLVADMVLCRGGKQIVAIISTQTPGKVH